MTGQGAGAGTCRAALGELVCDVASSRPGGFARVRISRLEREQADRASWAEVGCQVARRDQRAGYPAPGGSSHTTVRKPNCLGGESLARANRAPGQAGMRLLSRSVGRSCQQR